MRVKLGTRTITVERKPWDSRRAILYGALWGGIPLVLYYALRGVAWVVGHV